FTQTITGREIRVIDYEEHSGEGLAFYAKLLRDKPYIYGEHHMPHDVEVHELGTGKSRKEVAESFGIKPVVTLERPRDMEAVNMGIEAARNIFSRLYIDEQKCEKGLNALESYHKEYDEENKVFKNRPHHDWASNGADAFRTLAMGHKDKVEAPKKKKQQGSYLSR
ncbi:MAG TPA: hypothetical protein VF790_11675, partial [Dissulfurispiraceae bacterium]